MTSKKCFKKNSLPIPGSCALPGWGWLRVAALDCRGCPSLDPNASPDIQIAELLRDTVFREKTNLKQLKMKIQDLQQEIVDSKNSYAEET